MAGGAELSIATGVEFPSADRAAAASKRNIGAFAPFADPLEASPHADVFWSPDAVTLALRGTAFRQTMSEVDLVSIPAVKRLFIAAKGSQHLEFISEQRSLAVILDGTPVAVAPARVVFHVEGFERLEPARHGFALLNDFLRERRHRLSQNWTTTSLTVRDALVALDGHRVGASYRDIASVIFGAARVKEAWRSEGNELKDRIRRVLKRGLALSAGAYREFL
jgi:hypothetical protein